MTSLPLAGAGGAFARIVCGKREGVLWGVTFGPFLGAMVILKIADNPKKGGTKVWTFSGDPSKNGKNKTLLREF